MALFGPDENSQQDSSGKLFGPPPESSSSGMFSQNDNLPSPEVSVEAPLFMEVNKKRRLLLDKLVENGEIPPVDSVKNAILAGEVKLDDIRQQYTNFKKTNPIIAANKKGDINPGNVELDSVQQDAGFAGRLKQGALDWVNRDAKAAGNFISGATMGIINPQWGQDAPDDITTTLTGALGSVGGFVASSALLAGVGGPIVRAIPGVGGAIESLTAGAKVATGGAKFLKTAGAIALEAAPLGFATGAARSAMQGNNITDVLMDGVIDAGLFAGTGAALEPILAGAGKLFAKAKIARTADVGAKAATAGKGIAEDLSSNAGAKAKIMYEDLQSRAGSLTPEEKAGFDALTKMRATQPGFGPGVAGPASSEEFAGEIAKHPELTKLAQDKSAEAKAKELLIGPNAQFKDLYDKDMTLQSMMKNGHYVDALNALQGPIRTEAANYSTLGEFVAAPFMNNAESIYSAQADKFMSRVDKARFPSLNKTLIVEYAKNPTAEGLASLKEAAGGAKQAGKIFGQKFLAPEGPMDMRIDPGTADKIIADHLNIQLKTVANQGFVDLGDITKVQDVNATLNAAITLNKDLQAKTVNSMLNGQWTDFFVHTPPEIQAHIGSEMKIRVAADELQDAFTKRADVRQQMSELTQKMKATFDPGEKQALGVELTKARDLNKQISTQVATLNQSVNEAGTILSALPKETQMQVKDFVSKMYTPTRQMTGDTTRSAFFTRFNFKDNPYYVEKFSSLADTMNAIAVSGGEHDIPVLKGIFGNGPLVDIENVSRKMNRQLGPGNAISDGLVPMIKQREAEIVTIKDFYQNKVNENGIRAGSKLDHIVRRVGTEELATNSAEFQALPLKEQQQVMGTVESLKSIYPELFDAYNDVARANNIPEITHRENYFGPALKDHAESIGHIIKGFLGLDQGVREIKLPFEGTRSLNLSMLTREADPSQVFFGFKLPRTGTSIGEEIGAIEGFNRYLPSVLKSTKMMDLVRQVDVARSFAPEGLAKVFDKIKDDHLLGIPHALDKDLAKAPFWKKAVEIGQKGLAQGELMYKLNTVVQQVTSTALNFAIGGKEAFAAAATLFTKDADRAWSQSINRVLRDQYEGIDMGAKLGSGIFKSLNKLPYAEQIKQGQAYFKKWGMSGLQIFDNMVTKHAQWTGTKVGLKNGLTWEQAVKHGDAWADRLQVSMSQIDKPEYARTTIGRALFQFQSFTTNLGAALMNDLPNMAFHDGANSAIKGLLRTAAAVTIYNEGMREMGLPAPFDLKTFVPFMGTYRFGVQGAAGAIKDFYDLGNEKGYATAAAKRLTRLGLDIALPGVGQAYNIAKGVEAVGKGKVEPGYEGRAMLFGPGAVKKGLKQRDQPSLTEKIRKGLFNQGE